MDRCVFPSYGLNIVKARATLSPSNYLTLFISKKFSLCYFFYWTPFSRTWTSLIIYNWCISIIIYHICNWTHSRLFRVYNVQINIACRFFYIYIFFTSIMFSKIEIKIILNKWWRDLGYLTETLLLTMALVFEI